MLPLATVRAIIERTVEHGVRLAVIECEREHRRTIIHERVAVYLAANPTASTNAIYKAVGQGFDKRLTLDAVRALRSAPSHETRDSPPEQSRATPEPVCERKPPGEQEAGS
jgi:hypothetical protein